MKIRETSGGDWTMEHEGVEAPYVVFRNGPGNFAVHDLDTIDAEDPPPPLVAGSAEKCEKAALAHFMQTGVRAEKRRQLMAAGRRKAKKC